jgi:hypothetical protein
MMLAAIESRYISESLSLSRWDVNLQYVEEPLTRSKKLLFTDKDYLHYRKHILARQWDLWPGNRPVNCSLTAGVNLPYGR